MIDQLRELRPEAAFELVTLKTTGDRVLDRPLAEIGGKGLFVKELDAALLTGRIDLAVHSLKDLPLEENPALPIVACPVRGDPRDVLVLPASAPTDGNWMGAVGTGSARRALQLRRRCPDAVIAPVRGNILTRLQKLDGGVYTALILAAAGLLRAGLPHRMSYCFTTREMIPAAGQGILAVQARSDFDRAFLDGLGHWETEVAARAERAFVRALGGGCTAPSAAYAEVDGTEIRLCGLYERPDGTNFVTGEQTGDTAVPERLGEALADRLRKEASL